MRAISSPPRCLSSRALLMLVMVIVPLAFVVIPVFAGNPAQGTTTTGQTLRIQIDEPVLGRDFVPGVPFTLTGETVIGALNAPARLLYVVDVSLSTEEPVNQDCNGDGQLNAGDNLNGNSLQGDTLDCEISGVIALNTSLAANTVVSAGIVAFAASAVVADVDPAAGSQSFTALNANKNTNALLDIDEVARSLTSERVGLFTARSVSSGTDFNGALAAMNQAFATQTTPRKIAYFLSDGDHNIGDFRTEPGSPLANAAQAGIIVNTYSVGGAATGCGVAEALRIIADTTGGVCSEVADPSELRTILPGTNPAGIARVEVSVGGATPITATLNALGRWSANITACSTGSEAIVATVVATDGTRVAADIQLCAPTVLEEEKEPTEASAAAPRLFLPMVAKE